MRTKHEIAELAKANASANGTEEEHTASHSFLTEHQRAALDAALAAKQTSPSESSLFVRYHLQLLTASCSKAACLQSLPPNPPLLSFAP